MTKVPASWPATVMVADSGPATEGKSLRVQLIWVPEAENEAQEMDCETPFTEKAERLVEMAFARPKPEMMIAVDVAEVMSTAVGFGAVTTGRTVTTPRGRPEAAAEFTAMAVMLTVPELGNELVVQVMVP